MMLIHTHTNYFVLKHCTILLNYVSSLQNIDLNADFVNSPKKKNSQDVDSLQIIKDCVIHHEH